jgi:FAD/FMN-containing dehydrogenase
MTGEEIYPGGRVGRDDPRYPTLVRGFNLRWVGTPRYVELCGNAEQVRRGVQRAVDDGLRITVQGGGHCYENFAVGNEGGVILDLSAMNEVFRDEDSSSPAHGWYCIEGGATLWDAYTRLYRLYGVTIPAGSCYSVGAGGHIVGGGYGLLSRLHGLTVDVLHAVEVVVVRDGRAEIVTVSRESEDVNDQLLMWGHLGAGGGNFGVVTKYWFREPPKAPEQAHLLSLAWNWSDLDKSSFGALIDNYGAFLAANSDVGSPYSGMFALLHLFQKAAGQITLTVQYVGDDPGRLDVFSSELRTGLPALASQAMAVGGHANAPLPTTGSVRALPWLYATQTLNGVGANQRGKYKSAYMKQPFPEHQIAAMWDALTNASHPNSQALLQVDSYGCEVNAVASDATAVPQRSSIMKLQYQTYWTDPADDTQNLDWIRCFYDAMYGPDGPLPDEVMDGCYVNYPDVDLVRWQELYYQDAYPKLQRVKAAWDRGNVFNHLQSVELPDEG